MTDPHTDTATHTDAGTHPAPGVDGELIARRFPLVARPHPPRPPLPIRIAEVADLARTTGHTHDTARTAAAHNKAALIASDCGHPELARALCWRHHDLYPRTQPWTAQHARYALEPLVNLARLHHRDGDPDAALTVLNSLYDAVRLETETDIDGHRLDFRNLTASATDHQRLCRWLWTVLLADGLRALTHAGRWAQALAHAQHHNGIGRRLLDGRQTAILAGLFDGNPSGATTLLDTSELGEPWEHAIAACLHVLATRREPQPHRGCVSNMVDHYHTLRPTPQTLVFNIRLGLTIVDLAGGATQPEGARATTHVIQRATADIDGHTAREVLAHNIQTHLPTSAQERLLTATHETALDTTTLLAALQGHLVYTVPS